MIVFFAVTQDDEKGVNEDLEGLAGKFVLQVGLADEQALVRLENVEDHLAGVFFAADLEERLQ